MTKDASNKKLRKADPTEQASSNDYIGNFSLLATAVMKAAQFFTREGDNKENLRGSIKENSHDSITTTPNTSESLLPSELAKIINSTPEELKKMALLQIKK